MRKLLAALLTTAALVAPAHSATFKPIAGGHSLVMTGAVVDGDAQRLQEAYAASLEQRGFAPERIFLNSPGGEVLAGIDVAETIYGSGLHTVIGKTDECFSICAVIFSAGAHRVVFETSVLGVHSVGSMNQETGERKEEGIPDMAMTLILARAMARVGTPPAVIVKMITTPNNSIAYLTADDVAGWVEILGG